IKARTKKLKGAKFTMPKVSVGATINLIMGAVLAEGETILENSAMEPDVVDLGEFLMKMGADIKGLGTERIIIKGVSSLKPVEYSVMPDRIEAGTYLLAGAITRGNVRITKVIPEHFSALIKTLEETGFSIESGNDWVRVSTSGELKGALVQTMPHPGFPTDLQAPMMALMTTLPGISVMVETIFENRFTHVPELRRMGAKVTIEGRSAIIQGVKELSGAPVMMSDLRAGAALIVAGLAAKGSTEIRRIYHSDRGYEKLCRKLSGIGADIEREKGGSL
ncbi:MAG: UDP-N-acetylglucosamine 1-carboxyvinyltransferase, partial [Spirochaetes bacterium]|nr:UDP-N-acetylglucosamine 1-carboxyvinyltransferase [Spirochaetota bacterium]